MHIKSAKFVISNTDVRKCPEGNLPEYAFIGRSNVGKSSLINMLTNHKGLAMTSATPGKTLLINHFLINEEWYLVDLPGYGFAQRGMAQREQLRQIIENYILEREQLSPPGPEDRLGVHGMVRRKRCALHHHLHQNRQDRKRAPQREHQGLSRGDVRHLGRVAPHALFFV